MVMRYGVVGTSYWADIVHLAAIRQSEDAELVGLWGRDQSKASALAERHGTKAFETFDALLSRCDAITIALPPNIQADYAIRAAAAGKHLILEKPIAQDLTEGERMADAIRRSNVASVVFLTRRFVPAICALVEKADAGMWQEARINIHANVMHANSPYKGSAWRMAPKAALWDIGPHALSLAIPMLGHVTSVSASCDATGLIRMETRHDHGGTASVSLTLSAEAEDLCDTVTFFGGGETLSVPGPPFPREQAFCSAINALDKSAQSENPGHPCDVNFGLEILQILCAADHSIDHDQTRVALDGPIGAA